MAFDRSFAAHYFFDGYWPIAISLPCKLPATSL